MNGVDIVGGLLRAHVPLLAKVPASSIKAGELPAGTPLPAMLVRSVSVIDRQPLKRGPLTRSVERVSVTVRAGSYRDQVAIIRLVRDCCAGVIEAAIGDAQRVSILTAGTGPDVIGPAGSFEQNQDYRVSYDA